MAESYPNCPYLQAGNRCQKAGKTVSASVCRRCDCGKNFESVFPSVRQESPKALPACRHLGPDKLKRTVCTEGCGVGIQLKVFACFGGLGSATLRKHGMNVAGCCKVGEKEQCPKYEPTQEKDP